MSANTRMERKLSTNTPPGSPSSNLDSEDSNPGNLEPSLFPANSSSNPQPHLSRGYSNPSNNAMYAPIDHQPPLSGIPQSTSLTNIQFPNNPYNTMTMLPNGKRVARPAIVTNQATIVAPTASGTSTLPPPGMVQCLRMPQQQFSSQKRWTASAPNHAPTRFAFQPSHTSFRIPHPQQESLSRNTCAKIGLHPPPSATTQFALQPPGQQPPPLPQGFPHMTPRPLTHCNAGATSASAYPAPNLHRNPPATQRLLREDYGKEDFLTDKVRGDGKKCRRVYGWEKRDKWCNECRWKKACTRFVD